MQAAAYKSEAFVRKTEAVAQRTASLAQLAYKSYAFVRVLQAERTSVSEAVQANRRFATD